MQFPITELNSIVCSKVIGSVSQFLVPKLAYRNYLLNLVGLLVKSLFSDRCMIGETELQQIYWKRFKENIMPHEHSKSFGKLISYSLP